MTDTTNRDDIYEFVRSEIISFGVDASSIAPGATLEELGLDSLDVVELSQSGQRKLGIESHVDDFADARTLDQAVDVLYECAQR